MVEIDQGNDQKSRHKQRVNSEGYTEPELQIKQHK